MLDDWIRLWNLNVYWNVNSLDVGNVDGLDMGHWDWNFLDDCHSFFFVMMVMTMIMR